MKANYVARKRRRPRRGKERGNACVDAFHQLELLANAGFPPANYQAGEKIFSEGDKGDQMYVIRAGEVEIERDGKIVETLSPGEVFGEMALIDGSQRAATARARTACASLPQLQRRRSCSWCMRRRSSPSP